MYYIYYAKIVAIYNYLIFNKFYSKIVSAFNYFIFNKIYAKIVAICVCKIQLIFFGIIFVIHVFYVKIATVIFLTQNLLAKFQAFFFYISSRVYSISS